MTPCTRLAYFGSRVSVSLPDCLPGRITTAPSVVASFVLARTGRVSSGSSCSSRKDPSGAVRTGTPPSANPIGFGLTRWTEAPSTGFPAPSTHDAVERHGPRELEVGPVAVGSDVEPGTGLGVEPEMALRRRARLDQYLPRRDVDRVAPCASVSSRSACWREFPERSDAFTPTPGIPSPLVALTTRPVIVTRRRSGTFRPATFASGPTSTSGIGSAL